MALNCNLRPFSNCKLTIGGIDKVIIFPFGALSNFTTDDNDSFITGFDFNVTGVEFEFCDNSSFTEELSKDLNLQYTQTLALQTTLLEDFKRYEIYKLSHKGYSILIYDTNGKIWLLGYRNPAVLTSYTAQSGELGGENNYNISFTSVDREPMREIVGYNPLCQVSLTASLYTVSLLSITASTVPAGAAFELQGDNTTRSTNNSYPFNPLIWNSSQGQYLQDSAVLNQLLIPDGQSATMNLYYDNVSNQWIWMIASTNTAYPLLSINGVPTYATVSNQLRLTTTVNSNLLNIHLILRVNGNQIFDLPYNENLLNDYSSFGLSGLPEDLYVDVAQYYANGDTFEIEVMSDNISCGIQTFFYTVETYNNCGLSSTLTAYNSNQYTIVVDKFQSGATYRTFRLKIGDFVGTYLVNDFSHTSSFADLQALFTNILATSSTGILSYTLTEQPKTWTLQFEHQASTILCFITTYGDDTYTITQPTLINSRRFVARHTIGARLQTSAPSTAVLTISRSVPSFGMVLGQNTQPITQDIDFKVLDYPVIPQQLTNDFAFDITDFNELDEISIMSQATDCPSLIINAKLTTCLDAVVRTEERVYTKVLIDSSAYVGALGSEVKFNFLDGSSPTIPLFNFTDSTNTHTLSDSLLPVSGIDIFDCQYDNFNDTFQIVFSSPRSNYITSVSFDGANTVDTKYYVKYNLNAVNKQHPNVGINISYTDYGAVRTVNNTVKDVDIYTTQSVVPSTQINIDTVNNTLTSTVLNPVNAPTVRYVRFYSGALGSGTLLGEVNIGSTVASTTIDIQTIVPAYLTATYISLATVDTASILQPVTMLGVVTANFSLLKDFTSFGEMDNYNILYPVGSMLPNYTYVRTSINCPNQDIDALTYLYLTNTTNSETRTGLIDFITVLKATTIWNKTQALYPFLGDDMLVSSFNIKTMVNRPEYFYATSSGGWIVDSQGIQGNGFNTYLDTHYNLLNNSIQNNMHYAIRINSLPVATNGLVELGIQNIDATNLGVNFQSRLSNTNFSFAIQSTNPNGFAHGNDERGTYVVSRSNNSQCIATKNGMVYTGSRVSVSPQPSANLYIGAMNSYSSSLNTSTTTNISSRRIAFVSLGRSLTAAETVTYNNLLDTYFTTIGR